MSQQNITGTLKYVKRRNYKMAQKAIGKADFTPKIKDQLKITLRFTPPKRV